MLSLHSVLLCYVQESFNFVLLKRLLVSQSVCQWCKNHYSIIIVKWFALLSIILLLLCRKVVLLFGVFVTCKGKLKSVVKKEWFQLCFLKIKHFKFSFDIKSFFGKTNIAHRCRRTVTQKRTHCNTVPQTRTVQDMAAIPMKYYLL